MESIARASAVPKDIASDSFSVRKLRASNLDYSVFRSWIDYCKNHHRSDCKESATGTVPSMRLINCLSVPPRLEHARKQCTYCALSYVWGDNNEADIRCPFPTLPTKLPRVVEDAVNVTIKLGGRYLWVDRYCIPESKKAKHKQIDRMDLMYSGAEVTIVYAAGQDASYGLPGAGRTPRHQQPFVKIGEDTYVSMMKDPIDQIKRSKWWERAWCFQEAMLSRRRLVFTDEQVYFQCHSMYCSEVLHQPLDQIHARDQSMMLPKSFGNALFKEGVIGKRPNDVYDVIATYSAKNLTFEEDGLQAIKAYSVCSPEIARSRLSSITPEFRCLVLLQRESSFVECSGLRSEILEEG